MSVKKKSIDANHLEMYLMDCLQEAVDKAAEKAVDYLAQYIMCHWYSKYEPKQYERTYEFLESASKTDTTISGRRGGTAICMIYFDTNKIRPRFYGPEFLNPHASRFGTSTAEYIPKWIETGGEFYGRGKTNGLGSMEATIKMLEKNFHKMVKKELKAMGLDVRVSGK